MNQFNAQIDIKVMKLDEDIIQLRKGERVSAGFSQQKPQREMNNVPEKKEMFNPIIWYVRCKNKTMYMLYFNVLLFNHYI
jgi:hypothetical protein